MLMLYTIFVRKPMDYTHLLQAQKELMHRFDTHPEEFKIETIVEVSAEEFEKFKNNLLDDYDFVKAHDDIFLVKAKDAPISSSLIVDAQGFGYARYVGIPMQKCEVKKCPHCSRYFIEHPAISRKDNKTEICPSCGMKEAIEKFLAK